MKWLIKFLKNILSKFHTLRLRLILIVLALGLIQYTIAVFSYMGMYRKSTLESDTKSITAQIQIMNDQIVTSGYLDGTESETLDASLSTLTHAYGGRVVIIDTDLKIIMDTNGIDEGRTMIWENAAQALKGSTLSYYDHDNAFLTVTAPIIQRAGDEQTVVGAILVNRSMDYLENNLSEVHSASVVAFIVLFLVMLILAIQIAKKTSQPLDEMGNSIDRIKNGMGQGKVKINAYTEAEELADRFNAFVDKMQLVDESRQEFVSNVSHELKTPLTSMKVLADSLNGMENAPVELYQEFMSDIGNEIDRETKIINDLLSLVKMDKSGVTLNIAEVNMNELVESILKRLRPIADRADVKVVLESFRPVSAEIDETKLSLAITNLVENAIKYNNPGGWVHVNVNADHQYCYLRVEDNGMGIPEDSLAHIFERFYRVDKSHSREIGGTGLGLAITHNSIRMHHGEIKVSSTLGGGTTFDVRLPLSYIVDESEDVIVKMVKAEDAEEETVKVTEEVIAATVNLEDAHEALEASMTNVPETQEEGTFTADEVDEPLPSEEEEPDPDSMTDEEAAAYMQRMMDEQMKKNQEEDMKSDSSEAVVEEEEDDVEPSFDFDFPTEEEIDQLMNDAEFLDEEGEDE